MSTETKRQVLLPQMVLLGFGLSGAAALIYEVVWTRSLSIVMGSSTYALSTMLAAFMAGLSVGSGFGARLIGKIKNPAVLFALAELCIGIMGVLTIPVIKALTPLYIQSFYTFHLSFNTFSIVQFLIIFSIMGIPTTLMGITFPTVVKLMTDIKGNPGRQSGHLYCINTFGAILGSLSAGFIMIPLVGAQKAAMVAAGLNIFTACTILVLTHNYRKMVGSTTAVLIAFTVASALQSPHLPLFTYFSAFRIGDENTAKSIELSAEKLSNASILYQHEGVNGEVYLAQYRSGPYEFTRMLFNNGKLEAGDEKGFALLACLPYLSHTKSHEEMKALNIGLGSGRTLSNLASLPFSKIDSVELSKGIMEVNQKFLNPQVFSDPRINNIQADGRNFLEVSLTKYDVIVVSPSWAVESASAGLLTDEFFSLAKTRLHKTGTIAVWVDYFLMDDEDLYMVMKTMSKNFPMVMAWYVEGDDVILIGSNLNAPPSPADIYDNVLRMRPNLRGKFKLAFDNTQIQNIPATRINTDNVPVIEFHNARHIITGHKQHKAISKKIPLT